MTVPRVASPLSRLTRYLANMLFFDDATVSPDKIEPQLAVEFCLPVPDGASGAVDFVVNAKIEIIDATAQKTSVNAGANANSVQLQTAAGAANVTDAMSLNGKNVGDIVRALSVLPANAVFAEGATLRAARVKAAGDAACKVYVKAYCRP